MKIGIAVPCMSMVHTGFMASLVGLEKPADTQIMIAESSLVYEARDTLARQALSLGCERVLWLDSDMRFDGDLLQRLNADIDGGRQMVTALYFMRKPPIKPAIYRSLTVSTDEDGYCTTQIENYRDYPADKVFSIAACGFGAVMMTADLLRRVAERYGSPFMPLLGMGEDIAFCWRAKEVGAALYCDSTIKAGHLGIHEYDENDAVKG